MTITGDHQPVGIRDRQPFSTSAHDLLRHFLLGQPGSMSWCFYPQLRLQLHLRPPGHIAPSPTPTSSALSRPRPHHCLRTFTVKGFKLALVLVMAGKRARGGGREVVR